MPPISTPPAPIILTGLGTDAVNVFEDLSGASTPTPTTTPGPANPYDLLLANCSYEPALVQAAYQKHRHARNAAQRERLLAADFGGITVDPILRELEFVKGSPRVPRDAYDNVPRAEDAIDPRHCLVFWARPTAAVMALIANVQRMLQEVAPEVWLMPQHCLHLTVLEIIHSTTQPHLDALVEYVRPHASAIVNHPRTHRARLVRPLLSFDAAALAVSFAPAAGEPSNPPSSTAHDDSYTYHHLRRDVYALAKGAGVGVTSRYVVPSAHITIARFVNAHDLTDATRMRAWIQRIDEINNQLQAWDGEWVVGAERGVEFRAGRLWYGGGHAVETGVPF